MKIRKLQRIFSAGILSIIILLICPCVFDIPSTEENSATKLLIVYEKIPVKVNVPKKLIVKAVDDKGRLDKNRNDLIEFNLTSLSYPKPVAKLSRYTLNLVNGSTTVTLIGPLKEMLLITVNWKSGETSLESHSILMQVGGARFVNNEHRFGKNFLINEDTWILWLKTSDKSHDIRKFQLAIY